jgi:hypothetical protein
MILCWNAFLLRANAVQTPSRSEKEEFFEKKVRPILAERCWGCHSAEAGESKGSLRLDHGTLIGQGGDSGPAVVAGNPDESLIFQAVNYQGYENFALDELIINDEIDESDIITGCANVPKILYIDENNKTRAHFVDIYIPSQNRLIEVKSTWTFTKCGVLLKQKAAKELGYNYEIWVYDKKKNKTCYA